MVEMELFRIRIDDTKRDQLVVLREKSGGRILPIVIGIYEAEAIRLKINGINLPRPMTHDLMHEVIRRLGASVEMVAVHKLSQGTFFAKLFLRRGAGPAVAIDARPSDAIALAVRTGAPIFAEEHLLDLYPTQ